MLVTSSRLILRHHPNRLVSVPSSSTTRKVWSSTVVRTGSRQEHSSRLAGTAAVLTLTAMMGSGMFVSQQHSSTPSAMAPKVASMVDVMSIGVPTKEPQTGILFPQLCNGMSLVGVGVRIKYVFVKVYAVGTYVDPIAMNAIKSRPDSEIEKALLDPTYPRTIRIVMNRGLSIDKYTAAIVESIEPRLNGQELQTLDEFKKLNPPVDLVEGAEIEMTIRGDTLLYKNAVGGVGSLKSKLFCAALCDVYYGSDPVSPGHKEEVLKGIKKL